MTALVQKWGNSLAVRLPKAVADQIEVSEGQKIQMRVDGNSLVIKAVTRRFKLSDLLNDVSPKNRHEEVDWGKPRGKEVW
jgi:antitoxin MazE